MITRRLLIVFFLGVSSTLFAQGRWAVVNLSSDYMREQPAYEAENGCQTLMGMVVEVLDQDGYWTKIRSYHPYTAWVNDMALVHMDDVELKAYEAAPKYIFTAEYGHIYSEADASSCRVSDFVMGDVVRKGEGENFGWLEVVLPSGKTGWTRRDTVQDLVEWKNNLHPSGDSIVNLARLFVGVPYFWGGNTVKGFDCSGLSSFVYFMNGIDLPRNASQQVKIGREVSLDELEKGDLLFFGENGKVSHVGIYIGDGQMIHSSQVVRINSIIPGTENYYNRKITYARRIL